MKRLGIRHRILLAALAPAALVGILVTAILVIEQIERAHANQHRRLSAISLQLAKAAEYEIFVGNQKGLQSLLQGAIQERDVVAAAVLDPAGKVLATTITPAALPKEDEVMEVFEARTHSEPGLHWHRIPVKSTLADEQDFYDSPGVAGGRPVGDLLLQISNKSLRDEMQRDILTATGLSLLMLTLGVLLALELARDLIRTLTGVGRVVEQIGQGHLDERIAYVGDDELGQLVCGINQMADAVAQTQESLNARIAQATAVLRQERDEAAQAAEARSRFFAAASHDLRQPVQALSLFVNRLEQDAHGSVLLPRVRQLAHSIHNLQGLLDTLLDYSRLSGGVYRTDVRPVQASSVIAAIHAEFAALALEQGITLRLRVADCWLMTDPALLHRILLNLVSNALRHAPLGKVLIACRRGHTHARIEVWDTGPGIAPEYHEAIFEEMVQLDNPERDANKGLGLGLAIVRRTADLLHHPVQLKSRLGKGSCFSIAIPRTSAPLKAGQAAGVQESSPEILVLDRASSKDAGDLIELLDGWGLEPVRIASEGEATQWIAANGAPALMICETGGDIEAVLDTIDRIDAANGHALPALLIHPGPQPRTEVRRSNCQLLSRPFRPARLRALVNHLLEEGGEGPGEANS